MSSVIKVDTIQNQTGTSAVTIDSNGRVKFPQRIAFMGKKTDTTTVSASSSANVSFNNTKLAHASWDGTTFTAPSVGLYRLFVNGHKQSLDSSPVELAIYKNGAVFETAYGLNTSSVRTRVSVDVLMELVVGDTITFRVLQGDVYGGGSSGTSSSVMCSGYLIG